MVLLLEDGRFSRRADAILLDEPLRSDRETLKEP
jgi:hypothetical protein